MNITFLLRHFMDKFIETNDILYPSNLEKQRAFLNSFPRPIHDEDRAYYQYRCTMYRLNPIKRFFLSIGGLVTYNRYLSRMKNRKLSFVKKSDAVYMDGGSGEKILPSKVKEEFNTICSVDFDIPMALTDKDLDFLNTVYGRYKFNFYYKLKIMMKIGMYRSIITKYRPKAIISYTESSFASSIATEFCEINGVENINIMHGERLFNLKTSFVRFSRFYVWDEEYRSLMIKLRCSEEQFIIDKPEYLVKPLPQYPEKFFITYYLEDENSSILRQIYAVLEKFKCAGLNYCVRPHPRGKNLKKIIKIFNAENIQLPSDVSIEKSIAQTHFVASIVSTVNYEALCKGKSVILDDTGQKKYFEILRNLNYILFNKRFKLMSEILDEIDQYKH